MLTRGGWNQTDLRYNTQIHSIIVALSLHVVVLIKDLNGNHVIQKCLNKLTQEDNQGSKEIAISGIQMRCILSDALSPLSFF